MSIRIPAEWEPQDGVMLAWPHEETDWATNLDAAIRLCLELIRTIVRFEKVLLVTPDAPATAAFLAQAGIDTSRIIVAEAPTNDTWCRDYGPLTVLRDQQPQLLDFGFNAWGLKFAADLDNQVNRRLHDAGVFGEVPMVTGDMILEGGSIESNGEGLLLTTARCLLSPNRNPHLDQAEINTRLNTQMGARQVLWLAHGWLAGDDTDAHIDTLARLAPEETIVYVGCNDPEDEHFAELTAMAEELKQLRTPAGRPFRLLPLPWPGKIFSGERRLPATYANFLIINGAVLVPTYNDPADEQALAVIAEAFPDREIIGINALPLIEQGGSLHCLTMQLPQGVLS